MKQEKVRCFRKTILPVFRSRILSVVCGLLLLAACQYENNRWSSAVTEERVSVNSNSEELSRRVIVYSPAQVNRERGVAATDGIMPEPPAMEQVVVDRELNADYKSWQVKNHESYYLKPGDKMTAEINLASQTCYYIDGELTITNLWGQSGTIIVLPQGKLKIDLATLPSGLEIWNYGDLELPGDVTINSGCAVKTTGSVSVHRITVGGLLYAGGKIEAEIMSTNSASRIYSDCSMVLRDELQLSNNVWIYVGNYLSVPVLRMNSSAGLEMNAGALIRTDKLELSNPSCRVTVRGDEYAVLHVGELILHHNNVKTMFSGWLDIHSEKITNLSGKELDWLSNTRFDGNTYLPENDCRPVYGMPSGEGKVYCLEHLLEMPSPADKLSATSIQVATGYAYVSYHTYGNPYGGYIEIVSPIQRIILASLSSDLLDFNHLIADDKNIWTVGGEARGAFLGRVGLQGGLFYGQSMGKRYLEGASGNCVVKNGDKLLTATNTGYETFEEENLERLSMLKAASAKHLDLNGDKLVTLQGTDEAVVHVYNASDMELTGSLQQFAVGSLVPVNGKNVCKVDGDVVYVCLGQNGVKMFRNGVIVASFLLTDGMEGGAANGLDVDDHFVYVACGLSGLYVLDKKDLSVIAAYDRSSASANYVTVDEAGYIHVAYGLRGLQIFRLVEK